MKEIEKLLTDYYFYTNMYFNSSYFSSERKSAEKHLKDLLNIDAYKLIKERGLK